VLPKLNFRRSRTLRVFTFVCLGIGSVGEQLGFFRVAIFINRVGWPIVQHVWRLLQKLLHVLVVVLVLQLANQHRLLHFPANKDIVRDDKHAPPKRMTQIFANCMRADKEENKKSDQPGQGSPGTAARRTP
jgi:hypothetical protein